MFYKSPTTNGFTQIYSCERICSALFVYYLWYSCVIRRFALLTWIIQLIIKFFDLFVFKRSYPKAQPDKAAINQFSSLQKLVSVSTKLFIGKFFSGLLGFQQSFQALD